MTLITRYPKNPILTKEDVPYPVATVHNAGVALHEGTFYMLFRSHRRNGRSIIGLARSTDGYDFKVDPEPFLTPATGGGDFAIYEEYGVEDLRINPVEGEGYYLTYSAYSRYGVRIGLAHTKDFKQVERIALITEPDMRNVVIFPRKVGGKYIRLDRPHSEIKPWATWLSQSPDLEHWGGAKIVMEPQTYHWTEGKIGPGAPPIAHPEGFINIFHGVFPTMDGNVYRLGVALHDLERPEKLRGVSDNWILEPQDEWERVGYVNNVVFTCGAVEVDDKVRVYWGGADTVMCAGDIKTSDLVSLSVGSSQT